LPELDSQCRRWSVLCSREHFTGLKWTLSAPEIHTSRPDRTVAACRQSRHWGTGEWEALIDQSVSSDEGSQTSPPPSGDLASSAPAQLRPGGSYSKPVPVRRAREACLRHHRSATNLRQVRPLGYIRALVYRGADASAGATDIFGGTPVPIDRGRPASTDAASLSQRRPGSDSSATSNFGTYPRSNDAIVYRKMDLHDLGRSRRV
jgi:hypothetical protein